jgi:hypothetical protein
MSFKKFTPLSKKEATASYLKSAIGYAVFCLIIFGINTKPIYKNETVKIASEITQLSYCSLPIITFLYLLFLISGQKEITRLHTNLHWVLLAVGIWADTFTYFVTTYIIKT